MRLFEPNSRRTVGQLPAPTGGTIPLPAWRYCEANPTLRNLLRNASVRPPGRPDDGGEPLRGAGGPGLPRRVTGTSIQASFPSGLNTPTTGSWETRLSRVQSGRSASTGGGGRPNAL